MRNLFEELDSIKNLMLYEKCTQITEVSASSEPKGETPTKTSTEKPSETKGEDSKTKEVIVNCDPFMKDEEVIKK